MIPTARALELQAEVRDLVQRSGRVLTPAREFDLEQLHRTFVLRCHEALIPAVASHLVAATTHAPHVQLRFVAEKATDDRDLTTGHVDLEIGNKPAELAGLRTQVVASDTMMLVVRRGSTLDTDSPTIKDIADAHHVAISRRGRSQGPLDQHLLTAGLHRHIIATVPTVAAALEILLTVPSVTTIPRRLTRTLPEPLTARPLPFHLDAAPILLNWHRRLDTDPAHQWLRTAAANSLRSSTIAADQPT